MKKYFFFILIVLMTVPIGMGSCNETGEVETDKKPLVIAHRGASSVAPENTLASIKKALEFNADIIEIDVHLSRDNEVMVIHDATVNRTTNGKGKVEELTLRQLRQLDAGSWFDPAFSAEKIPILEEVLRLINGQATLLIEIKKGDDVYINLERAILEQIEKHDAKSWCIIQSFEQEVIETLLEMRPDVPVHKLIVGNIPILPVHIDNGLKWGNITAYPGVQNINLNHKFTSRRTVRRLQNSGYRVFVWTVNDEKDMKKFINLGVDGIITDKPQDLVRLLK